MRAGFLLLLAIVLMPIGSVQTAHAQDNAVYVVSYIDVAPAARGVATSLLRQLANASRKDEGNIRFDILQRTAPSNQFAIVAVWKEQKAYDAHVAATHTKEFRKKIKPHLISTIDDRVHTGMEIAATPAGKNARGALVVITHVDVPPPRRTSASRRSRRWWRTAARKPAPCASTYSSRATGRIIFRSSRFGKTRAHTRHTLRQHRLKNFAINSRP
jgi:quinol monooxygenase YgiN